MHIHLRFFFQILFDFRYIFLFLQLLFNLKKTIAYNKTYVNAWLGYRLVEVVLSFSLAAKRCTLFNILLLFFYFFRSLSHVVCTHFTYKYSNYKDIVYEWSGRYGNESDSLLVKYNQSLIVFFSCFSCFRFYIHSKR